MAGCLARGGPLSFCSAGVRVAAALVCALALPGVLPAGAAQSKAAPAHSHHTASKKKHRSVHRQVAPTPERITEIQSALAREGYYHGEPTGKWDEATSGAMKNFQQAKGLAPTGKIEALSLQKLGLGSPVAGMGAPAPAPPAAATAPAASPAKKP